ncbi:hypothetical protein llap_16604 [Limosa lapponica baueri]|uniref:Uncharacterized protein n=1 Tax=Limosa lapponica baueri TaxID=1758121 RepID=A0A2I0TH10_LIMLA|nr:hypothetical protein llap_16604 [Limosa lapponica baueri]
MATLRISHEEETQIFVRVSEHYRSKLAQLCSLGEMTQMLKTETCFSALLDGGQFRHIQSSAPVVLAPLLVLGFMILYLEKTKINQPPNPLTATEVFDKVGPGQIAMRQLRFDLKIKRCFPNWGSNGRVSGKTSRTCVTVLEVERRQNS